MICRDKLLLEVPCCHIRVSSDRKIDVCIDAHFPRFIERKYRIAFMIFNISDVQNLKRIETSVKMIKLSNTVQCKSIISNIVDVYLDARSTILSSSQKWYYTQLLRLIGPIIISKFFKNILSSKEEDVIEAGRAASIIENIFGKQISKLTNIDVVGEKSIYLILVSEANGRIRFLEGSSTVIKSYEYLYKVDNGFRRRINEILSSIQD